MILPIGIKPALKFKKLKDYALIVIVHKIDDILKVITVYKARKVDKLIRNKLRKGLWEKLK